jgi:hypothetical protein
MWRPGEARRCPYTGVRLDPSNLEGEFVANRRAKVLEVLGDDDERRRPQGRRQTDQPHQIPGQKPAPSIGGRSLNKFTQRLPEL